MSPRKLLIVALGLGILAAPLAAHGQPPAKIPRIGYLVLAPLAEKPSPERAAFLEGLRELGYVEGKTVAIEYRSAGWNAELLPDLAEELVRLKVDVIVTGGGGAMPEAARQATKTTPIVVAASADPVGLGLVASLALRPGDGLLAAGSPVLDIDGQIAELSTRVPSVFPAAFWVRHGVLVSYGSDYFAEGRQAARLVAKILRGARPQDLPVEGSNTIELAINVKTAKALGLAIPQTLLLRANHVIE